MQKFVLILLICSSIAATGYCATNYHQLTVTNLITNIYNQCFNDLSVTNNCIQSKSMKWFKESAKNHEFKISSDLSIIRTAPSVDLTGNQNRNYEENISTDENSSRILSQVNNFLINHSLKMAAPSILPEARSLIPSFLLTDGLAKGFQIPLIDSTAVEGRGFIKKVMIPFLLGLKFKTTVLVPITLALIALKTWKAMTFGLLSLVLSGALVIFKIAKPKVVNYEVVHYPVHHVDHQHIEHIVPHHIEHIVPHHADHIVPHHVDHIVPHHVDHIVPHHIEHHIEHHGGGPPHIDHITHAHHIDHAAPPHHIDHIEPVWEPHGWARSSDDATKEPIKDAQQMAFAAQI